jgi:hypothetical protein
MQSVPPAAIARTSTAMNIIRQSGASIGTAILSVILASEITSQFAGVAAAHTGGASGFEALHGLSDAQRSAVAGPLASAFASTFVWALVLLAVAFIPALAMALGKWKTVGAPGADGAQPGQVVLE